jgi:hypothetical protein
VGEGEEDEARAGSGLGASAFLTSSSSGLRRTKFPLAVTIRMEPSSLSRTSLIGSVPDMVALMHSVSLSSV